ncbi:MAG: flagellar protein FlaG [Porticoccaceae bacterium]|nr:flagellar protein FlaG [Porticoccaceae bacterium]MDG1306714.1 flagellar protein FlaG [Porticoccaceae bacterium]
MAINEVNAKSIVSQSEMQTAPVISTSPQSPKITIEDVGRLAAEHKTKLMDQISVNVKNLNEAIETLNAAVKNVPTSLHFSVDEASKRFVVQVTDTQTGEIIINVPGEAVLRMAKQLESLKGVLFDDKF